MSDIGTVLVTGAAGNLGAVGRTVVEILRKNNIAVRAVVRKADARSSALEKIGAEIAIADLTDAKDVVEVLKGCSRVFFSMSVSPPYLEASMIMAAACEEKSDLELLVNISQLTVSQMTLTTMTASPQQRLHYLAEKGFDWAGIPVAHVRATVFLQHFFFSDWPAESIAKNSTIRLPFSSSKTSPIAAADVALASATILQKKPSEAVGLYELTGGRSQNLDDMAKEYSAALGKDIRYVDVPFDEWHHNELAKRGLPEHVYHHFLTMAQLHHDGRYDRFTDDFEKLTGQKPITVTDYVKSRQDIFKVPVAQS